MNSDSLVGMTCVARFNLCSVRLQLIDFLICRMHYGSHYNFFFNQTMIEYKLGIFDTFGGGYFSSCLTRHRESC